MWRALPARCVRSEPGQVGLLGLCVRPCHFVAGLPQLPLGGMRVISGGLVGGWASGRPHLFWPWHLWCARGSPNCHAVAGGSSPWARWEVGQLGTPTFALAQQPFGCLGARLSTACGIRAPLLGAGLGFVLG